jgi:hypothetical protein
MRSVIYCNDYDLDLPKYILEQILWRLNPFDMEKIENEEFLHPRGR